MTRFSMRLKAKLECSCYDLYGLATNALTLSLVYVLFYRTWSTNMFNVYIIHSLAVSMSISFTLYAQKDPILVRLKRAYT